MPSNAAEGEPLASLLAPAYPIATTSRLTRITRSSVARYLRGYRYRHEPNDTSTWEQRPPVVIADDPKYASFLDLIDLLFVKEFLRRGITLQSLRPALLEATHYLGTHHFARSEFYTSGRGIFLKLPKDGLLIALLSGGQVAIDQIIKKVGEKLEFEDVTEYSFAKRWYPLGKAAGIVVDPQVAFGNPTLDGYGVPTANIYDLYLAERRNIPPICSWFDLPEFGVKAAVRFEHSLWA